MNAVCEYFVLYNKKMMGAKRRRPYLGARAPPPSCSGGGGVSTNAIVGGLEEAVGTAFGGGQGIETTLPLMAAG